jgi:hypothetical protein
MKCKSPLGGFALGVLLLGSSFMTLAATHTLTIHTNGAGIVNRNPTNSVYPQGSVVTLTAVASNQWMFTSWSGDATGSQNPINVTMDANKVVTANFAPLPQYTLTVSTSGQGSVDPPGGTFASNSVVSLTATASNGWIFTQWSGDVSGTANPISITMNANKSVTAVFVQPPRITSEPQSASVDVGDTVTFTVGATGAPPLSYAWIFNQAALQNATNASLTISNVQAVNAGNYRVVVTNPYGSATSQVATLTVTNTCSGSNVVTTCNEAELRQAIGRGGTVRLCCNGTISLTNTIQVTNDVTLDGQNYGVVISGNNSVRLFHVATNVTFELKGLTLADGRHVGTNGTDSAHPGEDGAGGAIYNNGGTVRLLSCVLSNNSALAGDNGSQTPGVSARPGVGRGGAIFTTTEPLFCETYWQSAILLAADWRRIYPSATPTRPAWVGP